jgi:hypothetical protein
MVCNYCAEAADTRQYTLHNRCKDRGIAYSCDCQHRVKVDSGGAEKNEDINGDGS